MKIPKSYKRVVEKILEFGNFNKNGKKFYFGYRHSTK